MLESHDTICAVASPPGGAARGVVRISGPQTIEALERLLRVEADELAHARRATRFERRLDLGMPLGEIEVAVMLWPTQRSYTGQPSAELHMLGAEPVLSSVVDALRHCGARLAAPGEFTLRAFLAGRIDLTQAEAVLGVIEADDRQGLGAALDQLSGGVARELGTVRAELLELLADVEAGLDFVEEDIQFIDDEELSARLRNVSSRIAEIAARMQERGRSADTPVVALYGRPNAGKSRLMNALSGVASAIVSDQIGTTRDPVEIRLDVGRQSMRLVDTAGIELVEQAAREEGAASVVDQAQRLGRRSAESADVRLWCVDASLRGDISDPPIAGSLRVATKIDLVDAPARDSLERAGWILTSAAEGIGIAQLRERIADTLGGSADAVGVAATAARCRETLSDAAVGLEHAAEVVRAGGGQELVAAELRMAMEAIGRVTGAVYTEEILDSIFGRFCIGK